jgi:hypothetical protein
MARRVRTVTLINAQFGRGLPDMYRLEWFDMNKGKRIRKRRTSKPSPYTKNHSSFRNICLDSYDSNFFVWLQGECDRGYITGAEITSRGFIITLSRYHRHPRHEGGALVLEWIGDHIHETLVELYKEYEFRHALDDLAGFDEL